MKAASLLNLGRIPKKSSKKRAKNELTESLYNPTCNSTHTTQIFTKFYVLKPVGILNSQAYSVFCADLQRSEDLEDQIRLINILNKTSQDQLNKFVNAKGINSIMALLTKASLRPSEKSELIDKILSFLNKISITFDIIHKTKVHVLLEKMKKSLEMPEDLCSKCFRLLAKWKASLEEWKRKQKKEKELSNSPSPSKQERSNNTQESDEDFGYKEKPTFERSRERPNIRSERIGLRNSDLKRNPRQNRNYNVRETSYDRRDSSNSRSMSRYRNRRDSSQGRYHRRRAPSSFSPDDGYKKSVQWEDDSKLCCYKFFKFNDEPSAPAVTEEEVIRIRQKLMDEENGRYMFHNPEEYKHKESLMEGESKKDIEKELQEKLLNMREKIYWTSPRKIKIAKDSIKRAQFVGKDSKESKVQDQRIASKLPCFYSKEYQIPEQPSYYGVKPSSPNETEPPVIPLHTVNDKQEEALEIAEIIEKIIIQQEPDPEQEQSQSQSISENNENEKMEVEVKEESKEKQVAKKPLKGILKKTKYEIRRQQAEERRETELKRKAEQLKLDEMLKSVLNGEKSINNETEILTVINNSKHSKNALDNIKILLDMIKNKDQQRDHSVDDSQGKFYETKSPERRTRESSNSSTPQLHRPYYGNKPSKKVKLNPELADSKRESQSNNSYQKYSLKPESEYRSTTNIAESSGEIPNKVHNRKTEKPQNYKTVPCRLFHSPLGCQFGDDCNYIHDMNYAGRETPNMHKYVRPLHSVIRNPPRNVNTITDLDKFRSDSNEMEVENVYRAPIQSDKHRSSNTYRRLESSLSFGNPLNSYRSLFGEHKQKQQNISFDAQLPKQQEAAYPKPSSNPVENQENLIKKTYKSLIINDHSNSFPDTNSRSETATTRHFIKDHSPLRPRASQVPQYQQKDYSSLKKPLFDLETKTYYNAIRIPPNPFIESSQSTEAVTPPRKNSGGSLNSQFNSESLESFDTRRYNSSADTSAFSRKFQSPKTDAYPSYTKLNPISSRGGNFFNSKNMF